MSSKIGKLKCPLKFVFFIWKNFGIPTNDRICRLNIPVVSKCWCCSVHSSKTLYHIFFTGDIASFIWKNFRAYLNHLSKELTVHLLLKIWTKGDIKNNCVKMKIQTMCIILWKI